MRNSTRLRFFLAAASLTSLAAIFAVACGDDDSNADLTTPDSGIPETSAPDTSKPDTGGNDSGGSDAKADTGPQYDAGPSVILEAGLGYDGGIKCVAGGQIEQEVNDTPDAANQLRTTPDAGCLGFKGGVQQGPGCSVCGVIFDSDPDAGPDAGDGGLGGTELEVVTFQIHQGTSKFYIQYDGNVQLVVTVEGDANKYVIGGGAPPVTLPYTTGKNYYVEVHSLTGAETPWRVTLFEDEN